ncbi:MAG: hypothetical protein IPM34_02310 [Saprospiraceae bacterium]|nr:hypothetical protein [Saprospiraceae bacterium]
MTNKSLYLLAFVGMILLSIACGSDDDDGGSTPCSVNYGVELQDELNALNAAAQAYGLNPNMTTCLAYKNAAQAYVNALEPYGNCSLLTGQQRADWEASLNAAKASVAAIQC